MAHSKHPINVNGYGWSIGHLDKMASKKGKGQILETPDCHLILGVSDFQVDPSKRQGGRLMGWKVGALGALSVSHFSSGCIYSVSG